MSRLSIIISVRTVTSTRLRPRRSISGRCVSLKNNDPVSSLYSLSNVPPVTKMRIDIAASTIAPRAALVRRFPGCVSRRGEIQRVEQHRERGVGLGPVLRAQAEQDDLSRVHVDRDDSGAAGHEILALQPAGRDHVAVRIPGHDAGAL